VKLGITDTAKSFMIDMWLARQTPEKVMPRLLKVIETAKDEFADAVANGGGIYAVGYCVGAKYVLLLAGEQAEDAAWAQQKTDSTHEQGVGTHGPLIKAGAIAHAAQVTPDDLAGVKVPMYFICVQNDPLFPEEQLQAGIEALEKSTVEHEFKIYPEVPHGKNSFALLCPGFANFSQALLSSVTILIRRSKKLSSKHSGKCSAGFKPTDSFHICFSGPGVL
jgi:dienelactone hydrolase